MRAAGGFLCDAPGEEVENNATPARCNCSQGLIGIMECFRPYRQSICRKPMAQHKSTIPMTSVALDCRSTSNVQLIRSCHAGRTEFKLF